MISKTVTVLTAAKITELTTKFPNLGEDTFVHERDYNQSENGRLERAEEIARLRSTRPVVPITLKEQRMSEVLREVQAELIKIAAGLVQGVHIPTEFDGDNFYKSTPIAERRRIRIGRERLEEHGKATGIKLRELFDKLSPLIRGSDETSESQLAELVRTYIRTGDLKLPPEELGELLKLIGRPSEKASERYPGMAICNKPTHDGPCLNEIDHQGECDGLPY